MSKVVEIKETKEQLTLEQFVLRGHRIANAYKYDEEKQAKVIGKYFDSVCRTEKR
jgi:hypothetical protein